jgi:hypothetical protein
MQSETPALGMGIGVGKTHMPGELGVTPCHALSSASVHTNRLGRPVKPGTVVLNSSIVLGSLAARSGYVSDGEGVSW